VVKRQDDSLQKSN